MDARTHAALAGEDVFLTGLRRKITHCASLLESGSHSEQLIVRLEALCRQVQEAGTSGVIPQHVADPLQEAICDMLNTAKSALQNDGTSTSYKAARDRNGYIITREQIIALQSVGLTCKDMATAFDVSESTVKRKFRLFNLPQKRTLQMTDAELDGHIANISNSNKAIGCKAVHARLKGQGLEVQRDRVRVAIKRVDPVGAAARAMALAPIQRRLYSVDGPNALWHIDGNHKLIKWKVVVHGGVDGYSRMVVFLRASNNNRAATVKELFVEATDAQGIPSRLRMDKGGENQQAPAAITAHRGPGRGSAIQGMSVHNQRIERTWVDVVKDVLHPFHDLFSFLSVPEHDNGLGLLDVNNRHHLWALHFVFLPRINNMLGLFQAQRNNEGLSTEGNKTPNQLFMLGMLQRHAATTTGASSFWEGAQLEEEIGGEEEEDVHCLLSNERLEELRSLVDPLSQPHSHDHAVDMLRTVLQFVQ